MITAALAVLKTDEQRNIISDFYQMYKNTATRSTEIVVKDKIGIACHFSLSIQHKQASLRGTVKSRTGGIIKPESQCICVKRNVLS